MLAEFVHLRVHSAYSLAEGAMRISDMISICKQQKMPAIAITDTSNLFGALEFSLEAAKEGVQPIIGCQVTIINKDLDTKVFFNFFSLKDKFFDFANLIN